MHHSVCDFSQSLFSLPILTLLTNVLKVNFVIFFVRTEVRLPIRSSFAASTDSNNLLHKGDNHKEANGIREEVEHDQKLPQSGLALAHEVTAHVCVVFNVKDEAADDSAQVDRENKHN